MFVPALKQAHDDLKSGAIDFATYKARIDGVMDSVEAMSDADKAKAFDKMFVTVRSTLTEQEEADRDHMMWYDDDSSHYVWESGMLAAFGDDFFDFYNVAYTGG